MVLFRYENKDDSETTIYKRCYKVKLIDLASLTYLNDIQNYEIKRDNKYPEVYTPFFTKEKI